MEEPLFVVRTDQGDIFFRLDRSRDIVSHYPMAEGIAEKIGHTVYDVRQLPAATVEANVKAANPNRYFHVSRIITKPCR